MNEFERTIRVTVAHIEKQKSYTRQKRHCKQLLYSPPGHLEAFDKLLDLPDLDIAIGRRLLRHGGGAGASAGWLVVAGAI